MHTANNVFGVRWFVCARCGFSYPDTMMTRQDGLIVCRHNCVFDHGADWYRAHTVLPEEGETREPESEEVSY